MDIPKLKHLLTNKASERKLYNTKTVSLHKGF